MPDDLKAHIATKANKPNELDTVWVSCEGENPADVENMGPIQYIPRRGFPGYYFPFVNTPGYLSPLVAVFFEKPKCKFNSKFHLYSFYKSTTFDSVPLLFSFNLAVASVSIWFGFC